MQTQITVLDYQNDASWNHDTGNPGAMLFGDAIQVWSIAQQRRPVTVDDAAAAFCVAPDLVREAIDWHPWMFVGGDNTIEHEGI